MSNNTTNTSTFHCPNGYEPEKYSSQLYYEDLDDNFELWLVRMPHDLNPSEIENKEINLDDLSHVLSEDGNIQYEYISDTTENPHLSLILPQKDNGKLRNIKKKFKGSIFFNEAVSLTNLDLVKMEIDDSVRDSESSTLEVLQNSNYSGTHNDNFSPQVEKSKNRKKSKKSVDTLIKKEFNSD